MCRNVSRRRIFGIMMSLEMKSQSPLHKQKNGQILKCALQFKNKEETIWRHRKLTKRDEIFPTIFFRVVTRFSIT